MKVIVINDCDRYLYPEHIHSLEEFVSYITNMNGFMPLKMLREENCVAPYYIEEEIKEYYVNPSKFETITEEEVEVLSQLEYEERLQSVVANVCVSCNCYEDEQRNDMAEIRNQINLDGECWCYEPFDEDTDDDDFF